MYICMYICIHICVYIYFNTLKQRNHLSNHNQKEVEYCQNPRSFMPYPNCYLLPASAYKTSLL